MEYRTFVGSSKHRDIGTFKIINAPDLKVDMRCIRRLSFPADSCNGNLERNINTLLMLIRRKDQFSFRIEEILIVLFLLIFLLFTPVCLVMCIVEFYDLVSRHLYDFVTLSLVAFEVKERDRIRRLKIT